MLEEAWHWLQLQVSDEARRLGYRKEAAALRVRHRRCKTAWSPHLAQTRDALLRSAERTQDRRLAVVLGGGILRDVPWQELAAQFDAVVVVDIVLHRETFAATRALSGRLRLVQADITGYVDILAHRPNEMPVRRMPSPALDDLVRRANWIASVNLLTQLPLLPSACLLHHRIQEQNVEAFAVQIMREHLHWLVKAPGDLCVITEVRDLVSTSSGSRAESAQRESFIREALRQRECEDIGRWQWLVHPPGELPDGATETREVLGLHIHAL